MDPDDCWAALLEDLRSWAVEVVAGPDSVEVLWAWPGGEARRATIVMTRDEGDGVVGMVGSFELAMAELRALLEGLSGPQRYLVHRDYRLLPSATPEPPAPR